MLKPFKYSENNITGSLILITECIRAEVRNFILSSSAAVYGEPSYLPVDEKHPTNPTNYYGYTKLCIEENLKWYSQLKEFNYVALRYFNAAGYDQDGKMLGLENNPANLIPVVMEVAAGLRPNLLVFGRDYDTPDGTGVRDYVHVTDLAKGHLLAADYLLKNHKNLVVNLGSEAGLSVQQILDTTREITGKEVAVQYVERRPGDPAKLVASSKLAKKELGWEALHSSVESIVTSTWKVYQEQAKQD
jgi:UDP-glucose 4-epimerase